MSYTICTVKERPEPSQVSPLVVGLGRWRDHVFKKVSAKSTSYKTPSVIRAQNSFQIKILGQYHFYLSVRSPLCIIRSIRSTFWIIRFRNEFPVEPSSENAQLKRKCLLLRDMVSCAAGRESPGLMSFTCIPHVLSAAQLISGELNGPLPYIHPCHQKIVS